MIDNQSIETLKNSIDIVDVIGSFIELKKAGANYKAPCPFHGEKTPSFVVSPTKQIYHCFGCGVGGDAIRFMMDYEKLSYPEAIEKLASMFNFSLSYTKGSSDYTQSKRVLESIQDFYVKALENSNMAKEYLHSRAISQNSIEKFGIGYVSTTQSVINFLNQNHIPIPQAMEAGIVNRSDNSSTVYARLTNRITFPIYSPSGAIVGFGGRTMDNHPAKYINSPQTKLFNKSRLLYGYHQAKDSIYKKGEIIVCEGYLDVIMLHQAGFENAVATLGTALTAEHLPLLRKGEVSIILAYDGDKAGINAAIKASMLLSSNSFDAKVVLFPDGADPADMVQSGKIDNLAQLFREAKDIIPFIIESITNRYDINTPREKESAFKEIEEFLNSLSEIMKESYIPLASSLLGISPSLFGVKTPSRKKTEDKSDVKISYQNEDIALLSILKTFIEFPDVVDGFIDVLDSKIFGKYAQIYKDILENNREKPYIVRLELDDTIETLPLDELSKFISNILIKYYDKALRDTIKNSNLEFTKKSYLIRKIKSDIIPKLKKGELAFLNIDI
jgi:DNA primase